MSNQEDIICKVRGMDFRDLLGLIVDHPFYQTDAYFTRIRDAIRARYVALSNDTTRSSQVDSRLALAAQVLLCSDKGCGSNTPDTG